METPEAFWQRSLREKRLTTRLRLATTRVSERGEDVIVNLRPVECCLLMKAVKVDGHVTLSTKLDGLAS
jgi:GTP cyclohydrolase I